jgi:hypothetical protein
MRFAACPSIHYTYNELFGGYEEIRALVPQGASVRRKLGHTFLGRDNSVEALFLDLPRAAPDGVYADSMRYWDSRPDAAALPRMLYADRKTYLVELPMKQDQMSMACSIESACRSSITTSWSLR